MKITIYDGATTIGGNKIYVEESGRGVFLDFGMNFAKYSRYYEEFISERAARGIYDLWHLDLIPKLNVYRQDLIPADLTTDVSRCSKLPVKAVLISHAHLDHAGNVALLDERIPIVGSPATMAILKALNDTGGGRNFGIELPYYKMRCPKDEEGCVIEANRKSDYPSRGVILTEDAKGLEKFLFYRPGQDSNRAKKIVPSEIASLDQADFGLDIKAYPVDHSIYGASAYVIGSDLALAYTGDFRLHGERCEETRKFVREARNARVLITEGTRVSRGDENVSEKEVYENAKAIVEDATGLVVADFSARNFERFECFAKIAHETGRELVITAKDAYFFHGLKEVDGVERIKGKRIYGTFKATRQKWEELVVWKNYGEQYVSPFEIRKNGDNYILCFSFYDMPHLLDIMPDGGVYIYSASEAFGEEQVFSFLRLWNWLQYFGFEVHGFRVDKNGKPVFEKGLHASGHVSCEELMEIVERIDPDVIIPVHTENPEWFMENFENVVVLRDGESFSIN